MSSCPDLENLPEITFIPEFHFQASCLLISSKDELLLKQKMLIKREAGSCKQRELRILFEISAN